VVASPHPFNKSTIISVDNDETILSAKVYDVLGNEVISIGNIGLDKFEIGNDLKSGMYIIKIVTATGTYMERIIKNE
jgi:hypothetical protein